MKKSMQKSQHIERNDGVSDERNEEITVMMKMLIELDENKIVSEGKYDLNKIKAYLMNAFAKRNMTKNDRWYENGNFTTCGSLILTLSKKEWFMDNVKQWLWYDAEDDSTEDLKAHYSKEILSA